MTMTGDNPSIHAKLYTSSVFASYLDLNGCQFRAQHSRWDVMRVSKGHSFSDDQKNENQSSISVFRFSILKNNLENKISIYFKFIKGPTVFRARDKRKTDFETNFVFHFLKESNIGTNFVQSVVFRRRKWKIDSPRFFHRISI